MKYFTVLEYENVYILWNFQTLVIGMLYDKKDIFIIGILI